MKTECCNGQEDDDFGIIKELHSRIYDLETTVKLLLGRLKETQDSERAGISKHICCFSSSF